MFLGKVILEQRKKMTLNQQQLANGICTQTVISRIENQNISPSVDVLVKICQRLNLTLNDVYSEFSKLPSNNLVNDKLTTLFELVQKTDFEEAAKLLPKIATSNLTNPQKLELNFLKGQLELQKKEYDQAVFQFTFVLTSRNRQKDSFWEVMTNIELAEVYLLKEQPEIAQHYFETASKVPFLTNLTMLETIAYRKSQLKLAAFLSANHELDTSNQVIFNNLRHSDNNMVVAQATDEFYYLAAINALAQAPNDRNQVSHYLLSAIAFAEYNTNDALLDKINQTMQKHQITELKIKS
ncbi:helix-turn-helix domain-containing protein [Companilactobacillus sp. FL22-1]|uniref:helix-turn-helix domain-containing protein n=1 Tax=Companilactobacillus sp. FL22-1 TaxID=3373892 RepID=UPI00375478AB